MITPNAPPKVEPFAYTAPALSGPPVTEQSDLDANPATMRPAWDVYMKATGIVERVTADAKRIAKDTHLSEAGKEAAFTRLLLEPAAPRTPGPLPALRELLGKLDVPDAVVLAEAEQVQQVAALPKVTDHHERLAEAFGRKSEQQRIKLLEGAMTGKDPDLAEALAITHYTLHGLGAPTQAILRSEVEGARLDPEAVERVRAKAEKLGRVRRTVTAIIDSLENAADHKMLKDAGMATLRRSDLTTAQKAEHIDKHGLAAFKALPA
jgi:hypothetical protein